MKKNKNNSSKKKNNILKKIGRGLYRLISAIYNLIDSFIITPLTRVLMAGLKLIKTNNKPFDRLLNNKIFLITFSLVIALFSFFYLDRNQSSFNNNSADILYSQPVTALYNEEAYVIEGLPETVDITLIGRRADLYLAKQYPSDDVVVDLRTDSPTYGDWTSVELTPENGKLLYVPRGFAHGFVALQDNTYFQYVVDNVYNKESEAGIIWNDEDINIDWQFDKYGIDNPVFSDKDTKHPTLKMSPKYFNEVE